MIAILDYGSGNIRSASRACEKVGAETVVTSDFDIARNASGLVVPGVGAFGSCMNQLRDINGEALIRERFASGRPTLGICVGMQILFSASDESSEQGIGVFPERVERIASPILPHIGWNSVKSNATMQLFTGIEKELFYFVHSYAVKTGISKGDTATTEYGEEFISAIEFESLSAVQFHPEKSGDAGLQLLRNWIDNL